MPGRKIDYLRISVTDRCNLRCIYCMPEKGVEAVSYQNILSFEEITRLVRIFVSLGIKKIRLTGGEPLVRRNIIKLIEALVNTDGIEEVSLTTNGILLSDYGVELKKAGIKRINISLDTLKEGKFKAISGCSAFYKVMEGIEKAKKLGFSPLKINMVVMKGINDDEIVDFVNFSLSKGLVLRFIEFMKVTPLWREEHFVPIEKVKSICHKNFGLEEAQYSGGGPAEYYKAAGGILGFINTSKDNCLHCNRLRLTSTGELKLCLYDTDGLSLRRFLRNSAPDQEIADAIASGLGMKEFIDYKNWERGILYMSSVGG